MEQSAERAIVVGRRTGAERFIHVRDLLGAMVIRDLKIRYKRSVLGIFWTLLNPLAQLLVFDFVFRIVLKIQIPQYAAFLFTGIIAWTWFSASMLQATTSIVDNRDLIRQPGFPTILLPTIAVTSQLIHFVATLPILFLAIWASGVRLTMAVLVLPVIVGTQFVFTLGLAKLAASVHVRFRDTQYLLGVALFLGFYLTPILYRSDAIPPEYSAIYRINPMVHLVEAYRAVLMEGRLPPAEPLIVLLLLSLGLVWVGHQVFTRSSYWFVEEL